MTQTITVEGMTCEHCEQTVEEALEGVQGATEASADRESESATVEGTVDAGVLVDPVNDAGYDASA